MWNSGWSQIFAAIGRQLYCCFQFSYFQYFELKYFFHFWNQSRWYCFGLISMIWISALYSHWNILKIHLTAFIQQEIILVTELFWSTCNKNVIIAKKILKAHHLKAERKGRHCMKYLIITIVTINPSLSPSAWKFFTFNGINRASSPDKFQSCALTIC